MKKIAMAVGLTFTLIGCAGLNYALENYSGVAVVNHVIKPADGGPDTVEINGKLVNRTKSYRIFDKPAESRLMITASLSDSAGQGVAEGLTIGMVDQSPPTVVYEQAAINFLRSTGRNCVAHKTFLIVKPQYEVQYSCK